MNGGVLVVAFNIALSVTKEVQTAVVVTAWVATAFLAVLWWVLRRAEWPNSPMPLDVSGPPEPPSSTLAMLHERGIRIDPEVLR